MEWALSTPWRCLGLGLGPGTHMLALLLLLLLLLTPAHAEPPLPSFAELEAAGMRVGKISVLPKQIFDTTDPKEDVFLFRWANALHIQTLPSVIERALLFKTGDPVSARLIEENERLLRNSRYLYDVRFRPIAVHDGVVDIEVATRDTWTLDIGISASRTGGANSSGFSLQEYNLLGTGASLSFGRSNTVDRSSNELSFAYDRLFGTWASLNLSHAENSDGKRDAVALLRPFYALDARWSAGLKASKDDRIDAIYNGGDIASEYRHRAEQAEVYGGWSRGLRGGWVQRFSVGLGWQDDRYEREPGRVDPLPFPRDEKLVAPFLRYALIEDRFDRTLNRNLVGRPEFFALGLSASVQLGYAATALGSSRNALLYSATLSRGFEPLPRHTLIASGVLTGQYSEDGVRRQRLGVQAQYYLPQSPRWLFYASVAGDILTNPAAVDELLLGGDNGLRGYPLRYQSGTRRALVTVEERFYTDIYLWQLFRIGGAGFVDAGRAWGGDNVNRDNPGWLGNIGVGLRFVSARAAFSNVLHVDIAFPLNAGNDIRKMQFLLKTRASF